VICDRFSDSTLAYQGYGRGIDAGAIETLNRWATGGLQPDLTILLDVPVDVGRRRKHGDDDVFISEGDAFHTRVREGYHYLAARDRERWLVIDGALAPEDIAEQVWERVLQISTDSGTVQAVQSVPQPALDHSVRKVVCRLAGSRASAAFISVSILVEACENSALKASSS
jgi:dTMP kinase